MYVKRRKIRGAVLHISVSQYDCIIVPKFTFVNYFVVAGGKLSFIMPLQMLVVQLSRRASGGMEESPDCARQDSG